MTGKLPDKRSGQERVFAPVLPALAQTDPKWAGESMAKVSKKTKKKNMD